jgi:2-(1,2-epoxy-1,2-dihydrophenyl)acetyl-CoA isomerase
MESKNVHYSEENDVAIIRLDRPDVLNAVDLETARHLREAVVEAERNSAVRCVLLTGAGKHFSAGGDVRFFRGTLDLPLDQRQGVFNEILFVLNDIIPRLKFMPKPVVASARGAVAGLGVSLVAACDLALAAHDAVFSMAYCAIGGVPRKRRCGAAREPQAGGGTVAARGALRCSRGAGARPDRPRRRGERTR